jgi:hypothetical protein
MQADREAGVSEWVNVLLPHDIVQALDEYRRIHGDPNTRQEVIRHLLEDWLIMRGYLPPPRRPPE